MTTTTEAGPAPRIISKYRDEVVPALREQFGLTNPMQVPKLRKIVVNMGIGRAVENKQRIEHAARDMGTITGQKPMVRVARKSIATFKIRDGYPIGCAVTLRNARMWEFFDRLVTIAIPRIRDFRGLPSKFDGSGNYSVGFSEQSIFPEISLDRVEYIQGMNVTFVTSTDSDEQGHALLEKLGFPFKK